MGRIWKTLEGYWRRDTQQAEQRAVVKAMSIHDHGWWCRMLTVLLPRSSSQ
ncbi:hypothetical protein CCHR01_11446 [Colletotrichum chrysophilum]|uniref:Uncharacterized protein n=1 Tax=Colletotrichum chrysophilum TaxID=1836956 RepID=A0AAD9EF15_9PEZI|nr:hypothetical protein CCHR01_11446 [Colletotrichum chrysophilum]